MTIEGLEKKAREIWGEKQMSLEDITVVLGVVYGDICRQARSRSETATVDDDEPKKELGNLIFSTIRWCGELGYSPQECIMLAQQAQSKYVKSLI